MQAYQRRVVGALSTAAQRERFLLIYLYKISYPVITRRYLAIPGDYIVCIVYLVRQDDILLYNKIILQRIVLCNDH